MRWQDVIGQSTVRFQDRTEKSEPRLNDIIVLGSSIPNQHLWEILQVKSFQAEHINTDMNMKAYMLIYDNVVTRACVYVCVPMSSIVEMCVWDDIYAVILIHIWTVLH